MKRKIVGIFVMTLMMATVSITLGSYENQEIDINRVSNLNNSIEAEDQNSPYDSEHWIWTDESYAAFAQSFIPEHSPITKIELSYGIYGNPPKTNYTITIKENIQGDTIVSSTVNTDDFINPLEFKFPDTELTIGMTYYIVLTCEEVGGVYNDFHYFRSAIYGTYENGELWCKLNGVWQIMEYFEGDDWDLGFTTYWRDYAPDNPEIDGPIDGKAQEFTDYIFTTTDPEGDEVRYYIEWGDGIAFKWIGPYESGEPVTKGHSWASKNNYTIRVRARDSYGAESEWTELEVSMPKTKTTYLPFITFLENHPHLFQLLRQILGL